MKQIKSYDNIFFLSAIKPADQPHFAEARQLAYQMVKKVKAFSDIEQRFPYLYFTDGATGAINSLIPKFDLVKMESDDYRYVRAFENVTTTNTMRAANARVQYFSYPYAGDGTFRPIPDTEQVVLDCSYMFASNMEAQPLPSNVDYAIFSLSKSHNLSTLRCGWICSRIVIPEFHILQYHVDYGSSMHIAALRDASRYEPNELYLRHKDELSERYKKAGATEGATNLFGMLSGDRVPYYMLPSSN